MCANVFTEGVTKVLHLYFVRLFQMSAQEFYWSVCVCVCLTQMLVLQGMADSGYEKLWTKAYFTD